MCEIGWGRLSWAGGEEFSPWPIENRKKFFKFSNLF
jgi:hypothetical protein